MTTDLDTTWDDLTPLEQLEGLYCEMHKDAYGVKARWYRAASVEQAQADIEILGKVIEQQIAREKIAQQEAIKAFEALVANYGGNVETTKRWQHDAYGTAGDDEFLCYHLGLPYGYFKTAACHDVPNVA